MSDPMTAREGTRLNAPGGPEVSLIGPLIGLHSPPQETPSIKDGFLFNLVTGESTRLNGALADKPVVVEGKP